MSNFALLFISLIILLSSLSESFEFIVHNEESLLVLCFVAFIFVAYSFLSLSVFDDFQKRVSSLEEQLLLVVVSRFKTLISNFNEFLFFRGLVIRFQFILALLSMRLQSDWAASMFELNSSINSLFLSKLVNVLRLKTQVLKPIQDRLNTISLMPLLFSDSFSNLFSNKIFFNFNKAVGTMNPIIDSDFERWPGVFFTKSDYLKAFFGPHRKVTRYHFKTYNFPLIWDFKI